jgi:hypothetical protein
MIARNKLRDDRVKRLKLFTEETHTYKIATQPLVVA